MKRITTLCALVLLISCSEKTEIERQTEILREQAEQLKRIANSLTRIANSLEQIKDQVIINSSFDSVFYDPPLDEKSLKN